MKKTFALLFAFALLYGCATVQDRLERTGSYFESSSYHVSPGDRARSGDFNSTLDAIAEGFEKLPDESHLRLGTTHYAVATGSAGAYLVDLPYPPSAYTDGMVVEFKAPATNTGAATIDVNSLGAKSIKRNDGSTLSAGDIAVNKIIGIRYNATSDQFEMQSNNGVASGSGTMASQNASAVSITGGTIVDVTIDADSLSINGDAIAASAIEISGLAGKAIGGSASSDIPTLSSAGTFTNKNVTGGTVNATALQQNGVGPVLLAGNQTVAGNKTFSGAINAATLQQNGVGPVLVSGDQTVSGNKTFSGTLNAGVLQQGGVQVATRTGTETLSGKTLSGATLSGTTTNSGTISGGSYSGGVFSGNRTMSGTTTHTGTISGGTFSGGTFNGNRTMSGTTTHTGTISGGTFSGGTFGGTLNNTGTISGGTVSPSVANIGTANISTLNVGGVAQLPIYGGSVFTFTVPQAVYLPSGWSVSLFSTNRFRITHNLGNENYVVVLTASTSGTVLLTTKQTTYFDFTVVEGTISVDFILKRY